MMTFKDTHELLILSTLSVPGNVLHNIGFSIEDATNVEDCLGINANLEYYNSFLNWLVSDKNDQQGEFVKLSDKAKKYALEYKGRNVAYGPRIMYQFDKIVKELKEYPDSRRAVMTILEKEDHEINDHLPKEDGVIVEFPCTIAYSFHIENGKLCSSTVMRSNNIVSVIGLDVFLATSLQRLMARALDIPCGEYHHFIMNAHIIPSELERAEAYVSQ